MTHNIDARIIAQPGKLGKVKAGQLAGFLTACLSKPEMLAEVNRRIAEEKKEKEATT